MSGVIVEHRETQLSRRLRRRRVQIAVGIAAVEALLVIVGILPWWLVVAAAAGSVALYVWVGRDHSSPGVRTRTWLAAVSQLIWSVSEPRRSPSKTTPGFVSRRTKALWKRHGASALCLRAPHAIGDTRAPPPSIPVDASRRQTQQAARGSCMR